MKMERNDELAGEIRKFKKEIAIGEFKGFVVDRSKSQQEIETQIDRLADEFRKKASSDEIHEKERDGDQNYGGLGEIAPDDEYMGRRHIPKVAGDDEKEKMIGPKEEEEKKQNLSKSNWI